jgi:Zn finger protein HypA/HybF involved in hydrogenase expression
MGAKTIFFKVCEQCGGALATARRNQRFCPSCARARNKASNLRHRQRVYTSIRIPCACGRRKINPHSSETRCSECRKERAAFLRGRAFAVPRAIGEGVRLPTGPMRGRG